jgi:hypothetical protein
MDSIQTASTEQINIEIESNQDTPLKYYRPTKQNKWRLKDETLHIGIFVQENIATLTNEQLSTLLTQLTSLQAVTSKQYDKNLENEKKSKQANAVTNIRQHSLFDKITLDVGGRTFSTFLETLMRFEDSYFYGLLNSGNFLPGPDGSYFIDRDPTHFGLIMTYLRKGEFPIKKLKTMTSWEIGELEEECDYYLLPFPKELKPGFLWEFDLSPSMKPEYATFSNGNRTITKTSGLNDYNCPVIGTLPVSEFTVQINSCENIMIGFCPIDQFVQNGIHWNRAKNSTFFYTRVGYFIYNAIQCKTYSQLKVNDTFTAIITGSFIRFLVNGVEQGDPIIHSGGEMYPVIELYDVGDSVMIVPNP